jgi:hypothetical protein
MNGNTNNNSNESYAALEPRILGDDDYPTEGQKPVTEEREFTEEQIDEAQLQATIGYLLRQLPEEEQQEVKSSGLLNQPDALQTLTAMVEASQNRGRGM